MTEIDKMTIKEQSLKINICEKKFKSVCDRFFPKLKWEQTTHVPFRRKGDF